MTTQIQQTAAETPPPFQLKLISPYSTRVDGKTPPVPYVVEGLLTAGGFSSAGGKPKSGKSTFSRYEAVCVAKGIPCLGRPTVRGEVILISLEDPVFHVDNCLEALGYDPETDARIHIVDKLSSRSSESFTALGDLLEAMPDVRLVIVDTLAKLIRVDDLNDYIPVMKGVEQVRGLARRFPTLHIQALLHCKKVRTDDVFDSLLGSTALRGEPDTNLALFEQDHKRIIQTETRIGKSLPATIIEAELIDIGGADVVKGYCMRGPLEEYQSSRAESREVKREINYEQQVIEHLRRCTNTTAPQVEVLANVTGRTENIHAAIGRLASVGVITVTGKKHSPVDPLKLTLNPEAPSLHAFIARYAG